MFRNSPNLAGRIAESTVGYFFRFQDTRGLRSFIEKSIYNAPFGVLVTQTDNPTTDAPRIVEIPLASLLMMR